MTDQPYPPLRPQPPVRARRRGSAAWPLVAGIVVLSILVVLLVFVLLNDDDGDGAARDPSPGASSTASAVAPSGSGPAPSTPPPTPSPTPVPDLELDTVAATTVDGLSVRGEPGTAAVRLGSLAEGTPSFVVDGPTDADGYRWYLVSGLGLPPNSGCTPPFDTDPFTCPFWFGWVAGTGDAGEPWLTPRELECPTEPLTAQSVTLARTNLERLACFGSTPISFRAWWPTIPEDAVLDTSCPYAEQPSGWLICQDVNYNVVTISENEGFGGVGVRVSIDPASGLAMPERGTWVELRAHLDHPAAEACDDAVLAVAQQDRPLEQYVLECRAELVLEAIQPVAGP